VSAEDKEDQEATVDVLAFVGAFPMRSSLPVLALDAVFATPCLRQTARLGEGKESDVKTFQQTLIDINSLKNSDYVVGVPNRDLRHEGRYE